LARDPKRASGLIISGKRAGEAGSGRERGRRRNRPAPCRRLAACSPRCGAGRRALSRKWLSPPSRPLRLCVRVALPAPFSDLAPIRGLRRVDNGLPTSLGVAWLPNSHRDVTGTEPRPEGTLRVGRGGDPLDGNLYGYSGKKAD
jgi:hypothetical protein